MHLPLKFCSVFFFFAYRLLFHTCSQFVLTLIASIPFRSMVILLSKAIGIVQFIANTRTLFVVSYFGPLTSVLD